jgi:transposase
MPLIRSSAIRIKRFRELKQNLRTKRDRLLVGIDIAKAQHVAQVRLAHTRILDKQLTIPNTSAGFEHFWAHLQVRQRETGVPEIVCAVEPTGTYHQALATFLETHGVDVVLVANHVAHHNRRTLDGTWGKTDPKDAHNLGDLLERGHALFYSLPDEQTAALRRLVRLLRHARVELGACKARFRNTLLPALGPAGEPLPAALVAALPACLQRLCPAAGGTPRRRGRPRRTDPEREPRGPGAALPPGLPWELTDLAARLTAVQARIAQLEAELVRVAQPLPAYAWLRSIPGLGPTLAALLLAELGDPAWDHQAQPAPEARGTGHHLGGDGELDGHRADLQVRPAAPALGPRPGGPRGVPQSRVARAARGADRQTGGGSARLLQGHGGVGGETPPPGLGRLAERAALRPRAGRAGPRGRAGDRPPGGARRPPRGPTLGAGAGRDRRT